ncbi:hypothetical protein KI387_032571, partial [Taxus chinensis]
TRATPPSYQHIIALDNTILDSMLGLACENVDKNDVTSNVENVHVHDDVSHTSQDECK